MTKPSLAAYCDERGIKIGKRLGLTYGKDDVRSIEREMEIDFRDLIASIEEVLGS